MSQLTERLNQLLSSTDQSIIQDGGRWYTTRELKGDMENVQSRLAQAGVRPGDRVLLSLPNSYAFTVIYLAVIDYGAAAASINPEMPGYELRAFLNRCKPVCGFAGGLHADALLEDGELQHTLQTVFKVDKQNFGIEPFIRQGSSWQAGFREGGQQLEKSSVPDGEAIAILLYTSGTTGHPKAVGITHDQAFASVQNIIFSHQLTSHDITYCFLPLFHINAQVVALLSTLLSDGKIVFAPKFSASKFWKTVCEENITWISAVPAVISILLNIEKPKQVPVHLRFVRSASAQLPILHARRFEQKFGVPIIESYGMTEAASQICVQSLPPAKRVLGSVGVPFGLELAIMDEYGRKLGPKEVGGIVIRGKNVITHYVQADNQNDFQNGWFHTGDVGYVDEEGFVFIVGRKKELINRGGEKISPYEVEDVIRQLPGIQQVAVIGIPDPKYGEQVAAYVAAGEKGAASQEELAQAILDLCRQSLSSYKCPSKIKFVSEIPVGPTGKVQRIRLKHEVVAQKNWGQPAAR
ncbi:AMP-binding protein [Heyndrickxia acidiproducens]|uniref:AMP-binding protein n=1 Tax=Heyndrickxia acidiproducens TaxID=1121084 RepID=UPI000381C100|nr:AMP-binding protein [Heyndrickxia acidiproducens]